MMDKLQVEQDSNPDEFDKILAMIENPVRRSIIKRLSQEPSYPLQLSKELGLGQQLVAKHLDALEDTGLVESSMAPSPTGPNRKEYLLKKSISLTVDFAPNLFSARLTSISSNLQDLETTKQASALLEKIEKITRLTERKNKISSIGRFLSDIDKRLHDLEEERVGLLHIRNLAMSEAAKLVRESGQSTDSRRVMYHILDSHSKDVADISESVNLREETVRNLLSEIEKSVSGL
ncbi:MAG TPA: helix-turn-helix domain-containing protein [Nitrososphaerales archaeon]|nr:helix-turn-helix domain-containing protein [Nitrososphaerales archaeon]